MVGLWRGGGLRATADHVAHHLTQRHLRVRFEDPPIRILSDDEAGVTPALVISRMTQRPWGVRQTRS